MIFGMNQYNVQDFRKDKLEYGGRYLIFFYYMFVGRMEREVFDSRDRDFFQDLFKVF